LTLETLEKPHRGLKCEVCDLFPGEDQIELGRFKNKAEKLFDVAEEAHREVERLKDFAPMMASCIRRWIGRLPIS